MGPLAVMLLLAVTLGDGGNAALGNGEALIAVVRLLAALWPSAALLLEGMMLTMVVCSGKMLFQKETNFNLP